jgi:hypothetical protein
MVNKTRVKPVCDMNYSHIIKKIINYIINHDVDIKIVPNKEWYSAYDGYYQDENISSTKNKITIYKSKSQVKWSDGSVSYTNYTTCQSVDELQDSLLYNIFPNNHSCDSYGSAIIGRDYMLLNAFGCSDSDLQHKKSHVPITQICLISVNGVVEYLAVDFNIRTLKFVVVKYIKRELPKSITDKYTGKDLFEHFGQKRAFWYDLGKDIISLRTTLELYDVTPEKFKQSDEYIDTLSYPRLLLSESRSKKIERILELENIV